MAPAAERHAGDGGESFERHFAGSITRSRDPWRPMTNLLPHGVWRSTRTMPRSSSALADVSPGMCRRLRIFASPAWRSESAWASLRLRGRGLRRAVLDMMGLRLSISDAAGPRRERPVKVAADAAV